MKSFSNAFCFMFLLLVLYVETIKLGGATPIYRIAKNVPHVNMIQVTQTIEALRNKWVRIKNTKTKKCVRFVSLGARLNQEDCSDTDEFYWMLLKNADKSFLIVSRMGNYVFDNANNKKEESNPILSMEINMSEAQRWLINSTEGSSFRFINKGSNMCFDLSNETDDNGPVFILALCNDTNISQNFELELKDTSVCRDTSTILESYLNKPIQIISTKSGKCLKYAVNDKIQQFDCDLLGDFAWVLEKNEDGTYFIKSYMGDYLFNSFESKTLNGSPIITWRKYGGDNQRWKIFLFNRQKNSFYIRGKQSDKCVDLPLGDSNNGVSIQLYDCIIDNMNQEFLFKRINPIIVNDLIKEKYLDKIVSIINPKNKKCLKLSQPNGRLLLDECKNLPSFGWKITFNEKDNSYFITSILGNYVFDNAGGKSNNGNEILTYGLHGGENQRWYISYWNSNSFFFKGKQSGKCIDIPDGKLSNGTGIQLWNCEKGNENQNWVFNIFSPSQNEILKLLKGKWVQIQNPKTGKCLKFENERGKLVTYDCENLGAVSWLLDFNDKQNYYTISSYLGDFSFENSDGKTNNGNPISVSTTSNSNSFQRWQIESFDSTSFYIMGMGSNKCIDVPGGQSSNNIVLHLWDCIKENENQNFVFKIVDPEMITEMLKNNLGKWYKIQNNNNEKCWKFSSVNSKLLQDTCLDSDEFAWQIVKNSYQTYTIKSKSGNYVIDITLNNYNNGTPILTPNQNNSRESQKWYFIPWGQNKWRIIDTRYGKSIDSSSVEGLNLWESINRNSNQGFSLTPLGEKVKIKGYIKNAENNKIIPFCELIFGGLSITYTNDQMTYIADMRDASIYETSIPRGIYNRTVTLKDHYKITESVKILGSSDESNFLNTIFMSRVVEGWRFTLTWDRLPKDFGITIINPSGDSLIDQSNNSQDVIYKVNVDSSKNGYGPQTISLKEVKDGVYKFYVNNMSKELPLSESKAKVYVFHGNDLATVININPKPNPLENYWWYVFYIDTTNDKLVVINNIINDIIDINSANLA